MNNDEEGEMSLNKDGVIAKVKETMEAPSCCAELKDMCAKYCDCPACAAGAVVLENRDSILS